MVGHLQWLVSLGRFNINAQVATMSSFRGAPTQEIGKESRGFTSMPLRLMIMQLDLELINLTIPSYLTKSLIGHILHMVMSKKSFLMTCQNHMVRHKSPPHPWMLILTIA